ncbi:MAG: hypothetical protein M1495_21665 [Bacteroidetes bacterium]|nr:hypothetical protein [Bacteroidota bacterium]MCL6100538.1 hypothetical protein [Bacteroidota bacterium]
MKPLFFFLVTVTLILTACTSLKENTNADTQKYVSEKIPPGTAIVVAVVQAIEENSSFYTLNTLVQKVNGYGQSTKPIAAKTVLKIDLAKILIANESGKEYLQIGSVYELEISQPQKTMNNSTGSTWQANTIKKLR